MNHPFEERLKLLIEECSEVAKECLNVQQACTKILRHGKSSYNPFDDNKTLNIHLLEKELGHLHLAMKMMFDKNDVNVFSVFDHMAEKSKTINKWLHYNKVEKIDPIT